MLDKNFWGTLLIRRNTISKRPLETLMKPRVKLSRRWLVYSLFSNRLFKFSFPLHSPILKPYFNLCFCKFQVGCYFNSSCPCKIFAKVELLLQFNQLSLCEGEPLLLTCCRFLLLVRACFLFFRDTCYCSCKKNRKKFLLAHSFTIPNLAFGFLGVILKAFMHQTKPHTISGVKKKFPYFVI